MKDTEIINLDGTVSIGEDLPYTLEGHCMLTLDDGRVIIIGGKNQDGMKEKVWFFNSQKNPESTFEKGPSLKTPRQNHACALFNNPMNGNKKFVLVAGGQGEGTYLKDTEILEIKSTYDENDEWNDECK